MKEQLSPSVEAKGCAVRRMYTGIYPYIFPASAGISHDPIAYNDFYIFYNRANNVKCTQLLNAFLLSFPTYANETSTRSSSKATVVPCAPLTRRAR